MKEFWFTCNQCHHTNRYKGAKNTIPEKIYCKKCGGLTHYAITKEVNKDGKYTGQQYVESDLQTKYPLSQYTSNHTSYIIECPYCHATNVRKIGIVTRSVSAGLFGLGSKKIGKQWHCDHCGSDF